MLIHPESLTITSTLSPAALADALRTAGAEWREGKLSPAARAAGILGWKVQIREDRVRVRARIAGRNSFAPYFVGIITTGESGALLTGQLRLHPFSRGFLLLWCGLLIVGPFASLFQPGAGKYFGERILVALIMTVPCVALLSFGIWMADRGYQPPASAIKEWLSSIANPQPSPVPGLVVRGV
jgi:hypothetical protein